MELIEADRKTLLAKRAEFAGAVDNSDERAPDASLEALKRRWEAERKPAKTSVAGMRNAIDRFEPGNGKLVIHGIGDEHARRLKDALITDPKLKNRSKGKLWSLMRTLIGTACNEGLLAANPFTRVKLKLEDDALLREDLTKTDLVSLFDKLEGDEWWLARIALYTGAWLIET